MSDDERQPKTALLRYARLESLALWRSHPHAQRKEVLITLRESSLEISDTKSEVILVIWALAAIRWIGGDDERAVFSPDPSQGETLEISDSEMIGALNIIQNALTRKDVRPRRLRWWVGAGGAVLLLGALFLWLPGALISRTAAILPDASREMIARTLLDDIGARGATVCRGAAGRKALAQIKSQLPDTNVADIIVLKNTAWQAVYLPNDVIAISRAVVEMAPGPEFIAELVLKAAVDARQQDPLVPVLKYAGVVATLTLFTTGTLPKGSLRGFESVWAAQTAQADTPDMTATSRAALPEDAPAAALMSDALWVGLQNICL